MKQQTKVELTERNKQLDKENTLNMLAVQAFVRNEVLTVPGKVLESAYNEGQGSYQVRWFPCKSMEAIVLITFAFPSQRSSTSVM